MNKRHYEHTLPNIRGSLSNTYIYIIPQGVFLHIKIDPYLHHLQSTEEKAFGIRTSTSTYIPNREKMM